MSYARETLTLHSVAPDLIPADAPLESWTQGRNVVFRNQDTFAAAQDAPTLAHLVQNARTMVYVEPFDTGYWVIANEAGIWACDGGTSYDITPAGWAPAAGTWTSGVINGLAFVNVSTADPVYWDGNPSNVMLPLPDWPAGGRCLCMRAHKNFLFAIGFISEGAQRVRWSDAAEAGTIPQSWTPAPDNMASFRDLAPLSSACIEGITTRDDLLVFKRESVWAFTFLGQEPWFQSRKLFAERGAAATNGATRGPNDEVIYIGSDGDCYLTDGVNNQSILDGRAQRFFYQDFNEPPGGVYSAATLMREKLGIICYPKGGDLEGTTALLFDYASGDIGFRDMPNVLCLAEGRELQDVGDSNSWDGDAEAWDQDNTAWNQFITAQSVEDVLGGTTAGQIRVGGGDLALPVSLEKSGLAFGNPQARKMINRVWPKVTGREGDVIRFRIGGQESAGGAIALSPPVDHVIGSGQPIDTFCQGRFLSIIAESDDSVAPWRMGSIDVEYREVGGW